MAKRGKFKSRGAESAFNKKFQDLAPKFVKEAALKKPISRKEVDRLTREELKSWDSKYNTPHYRVKLRDKIEQLVSDRNSLPRKSFTAALKKFNKAPEKYRPDLAGPRGEWKEIEPSKTGANFAYEGQGPPWLWADGLGDYQRGSGHTLNPQAPIPANWELYGRPKIAVTGPGFYAEYDTPEQMLADRPSINKIVSRTSSTGSTSLFFDSTTGTLTLEFSDESEEE